MITKFAMDFFLIPLPSPFSVDEFLAIFNLKMRLFLKLMVIFEMK